jgi:transglutaminase-like putative cysteine protease
MKKLFLTLWILLCAGLATAQLDLSAELIARETLLAAAYAAVQEPEADLLLVEDQTRIRYETDGTSSYLSDSAYKILTESGRQEKSTVQIGYSASYGNARFVRAEVIKPNGQIIALDLAVQSREAIDQGQMAANIYDPSHKTVQLTVPGLEIGDVLRCTVASEMTKTIVPETWSDLFTLEETFPIRRAVIEVDAPAALPLARSELRNEISGTVTRRIEQNADRIRYTWEARNVPRMFEEPGMPEAPTVVQRLLLSTIPDWESLSKWYWSLSKPRLDTVTPAMQSKVRELTDGLTDRQEKIRALFRFVSQEVRYMGITIEDEAPGYEPHDVSLTFNNRYGVCRDKAALLVALLQQAGFEACPVLIYVGPKKDPAIPQPWFNHAITAVREENGCWQLMDPTNENTRDLLPAYLSDCSYLVASPQGESLQTSPIIPPEQNLLAIEIDARIDDSGKITARAGLSFSGINDTAYRGRLAALKPEEREPYFEDRLKQAFGPARLIRLEIQPDSVRDTSQPLSVTLDFEIERALIAGPEIALLHPPTLINHLGLFGRVLGDGAGLDRRRWPLRTEITCGVTETVRLDLSRSGLQPALPPAYETVDTPELFLSRSASFTNGILLTRADLMLRTVEFTPEQYLTLKQTLQAAERNARRRILLEPAGAPADADLITLSETVLYSLQDTSNWIEDRTVRQKVLSYAGKRELSDLHFSYNPAMEQVVLSSATVTAPDGTVKSIEPTKEVNLMDAPWSSEAPRYPAGKILVASLPGVEIGSVIEYRVLRLCKEMPFFSAFEAFAGNDPLLEKTVRVETPPGLPIKFVSSDLQTIRQRTTHKNGIVAHEWSGTRRETVKREADTPPDWILCPSVLLSCGQAEKYAEQVEKALQHAAEQSPAVAAQARELTRGLRNRTEKIEALRDFADRAVREAGPGLPSLPLSAITPADRTLAEGYGNSTDRAVLLYALLDAVKLKPRFILASGLPRAAGIADPVRNTLQREVFDRVLVAVSNDRKETVYLGDSGQYAAIGALASAGRPAIDLRSGKPATPQALLPDAEETTFLLDLAESGDVRLSKQTRLYGTLFESFHARFAQLTPEERRREHQAQLKAISQSAQATSELKTGFSHPGTIEFEAALPAYAAREGDRLYLILPGGLGNLLGLKTSDRRNPFQIDEPLLRTITWDLLIPEGWEIDLIPEPFSVDLPAGAGRVETSITPGAGRLVIRQQAQLNPTVIPPTLYNDLLDLNARLTAPAARTILLHKKISP